MSTETDIATIAFAAYHRVEMNFYPTAWNSVVDTPRDWEINDFPPNPKNLIPQEPGVYAFIVEPSIFSLQPANGLLYIGKATNLYQRISAYIHEIEKEQSKTKRPYIWKMLNVWSGHLKYYHTITPSEAEAKKLETNMIKAFRPPFNNSYDAETSQQVRAF